MRRRIIAPALAALLLLVGCDGSSGGPAADASPSGAPSPEPSLAKVIVPQFVGIDAEAVAIKNEATGLDVSTTLDVTGCPDYDPDGAITVPLTIQSQEPTAGQWADAGSKVELIAAPDCAAFQEARAAAEAEAARVAEEERVAAEAEAARIAEQERIAAATVSQQNARRMALDYLEYTAFSRTGLIEQLEYEGFSSEDATWALDSITVDWMEQAAQMARDYMDYSAFSRSGLIDQLVYEGFSREEAEHGASAVGL